jgi:uncharacterized C2H2 Zn-finger protein
MKRLACVFGRHRWTIHDENGEVYDVCPRCGKLLRYRPSGAEEFGKRFADATYLKRGEGGGDGFGGAPSSF